MNLKFKIKYSEMTRNSIEISDQLKEKKNPLSLNLEKLQFQSE